MSEKIEDILNRLRDSGTGFRGQDGKLYQVISREEVNLMLDYIRLLEKVIQMRDEMDNTLNISK